MSFPETIQAIGVKQTGDINVLERLTLPFPAQEPGDVIVKIHYAGINFIDTYYRQGTYSIQSLPSALGNEASGVIVALPTDDTVLQNEDYRKRGLKVGSKVGVFKFGSHAEYVSPPWKSVYPVPDSVSLEIAAASLLQGLTALSFITEAYNVKKGDYVFVHTVAGGVGLLFAQLAKQRGAIVIGTTSSQEKAELAKAHGADHVILYPVEDVVQRTLEITNGEGVHVIYDGVGKDTFLDDFKLVRRKGTIVVVGAASGPVEPIAPLKLVEKNVALLRPTMANYILLPSESLYYGTELFKLISEGSLKINIFKTYPFTSEGAREAQTDLTTRGGKTTGKLLIKIADE